MVLAISLVLTAIVLLYWIIFGMPKNKFGQCLFAVLYELGVLTVIYFIAKYAA